MFAASSAGTRIAKRIPRTGALCAGAHPLPTNLHTNQTALTTSSPTHTEPKRRSNSFAVKPESHVSEQIGGLTRCGQCVELVSWQQYQGPVADVQLTVFVHRRENFLLGGCAPYLHAAERFISLFNLGLSYALKHIFDDFRVLESGAPSFQSIS